jgi:hypothetical protein
MNLYVNQLSIPSMISAPVTVNPILTQLLENPSQFQDNEVILRQKSLAEVVGEKVLKPVIQKIQNYGSSIWSLPGRVSKIIRSKLPACTTQVALGAISGVITKNPLPLACGLMTCLPQAVATVPEKDEEQKIKDAAAQEDRKWETHFKGWIERREFVRVINESQTLIKLQQATPTIQFYRGIAWKNLGNLLKAQESFAEAAKDSTYSFAKERVDVENIISDPDKMRIFREEFLKSISYNIPDHSDYVTMAALVYYTKDQIEESGNKSVKWSSLNFKNEQDKDLVALYWNHLKKKNWTILDTSEAHQLPKKPNGYRGIAFKNNQTGHIIISHRGSANVQAIANDIQLLSNKQPDQYDDADEFTKIIQKQHRDFPISTTGHSLGAAIAELSAYRNHFIAVTVDSPGIAGIILSKYNQADTITPRIVTYFSWPNIVNACCGKHIGELRAVFFPQKIPESLGVFSYVMQQVQEYALSFFSNPTHKFIQQLKQDIDYHSVFKILSTFDNEIGGAKNYRAVKRWPIAPNERLRLIEICEEHNIDLSAPSTISENGKVRLESVYKTETPKQTKMNLTLFSDEAQQLLQKGHFYSIQNPLFMSLYEIDGAQVVMRSDTVTIQEFKNYLEHKIIEARTKNLSKLIQNKAFNYSIMSGVL